MLPVGVTKKGKKGQKLSCVKLAICPDHPRRHRPLKFCVRGRVREVVIYFKFHENRSRGLGAVGGRKSPFPHWQRPWLTQQLVHIPYKPWYSAELSPNSTWLDSTRHDSTRSTCRAHAFWLCRGSRTAQLDSLDPTSSTRSTGSTRNLVCCVVCIKLYCVSYSLI